jgi:hypothetical protein
MQNMGMQTSPFKNFRSSCLVKVDFDFSLVKSEMNTENNKLNIYIQYLMNSTFETICLFFHRPVGLVELLILYAQVQIYTSDYRLISKTVKTEQIWTPTAICATVVLHGPAIFYFFFRGQIIELIITFPKANLSYEVITNYNLHKHYEN